MPYTEVFAFDVSENMVCNKSAKFALLAVSALCVAGVAAASGLPQGGVVQQGVAGIQYNGDSLNIHQSTNQAVIDWKNFSVGEDNTVNFNQPNSDSATLNRVTGDFTSHIAGRINSNGSVFLVNPNGIMITESGVVDTGNFVASTLDIDNNDFLKGDYTFTKSGSNGVVANRGRISVDDGGFVALLGGAVKNDGFVRAFVGKVGFAGGEKIVMSLGNNDFLRVEVPTDKWHTLTDSQGNKVSATLDLGGTMDARGGFIHITVADTTDILRQTICIDGIVSANTVSSTGGVISISGGTLGITGNGRITANADYGNAGTITIKADSLDSSGTVSAVARNGTGGTVKVSLQQGANLNASTRFAVSGRTGGGRLSLIGGFGKSGTKILGSADFKADSTDGYGGYIDISNKGGLVGLLSGTVSAMGKTRGGRIRLGGAFQGGTYNPKTSQLDKRTQDVFVTRWSDNSPLVSANKTALGTGVNVIVSSQSATGGTAILWADHTTNNYAAIDATGNTKGGAVEISGKKQVDSFGLKRVQAGNGVILLDPKDVTKTGIWASTLGQIYKISANGNYKQSLQQQDHFGSSVSLSDDATLLAVGASGSDTNSGAVYLYTIDKSQWGKTITQQHKIAPSALKGNDFFGSGVSLSADGSKLAVGAYGDDDGGSNKGAVYLFTSGDAWATITQTQKIAHNASLKLNDDDAFGRSVSLSNDGSKLAVGADGDTLSRGAVYVFNIDTTTATWGDTVTQQHKIAHGETIKVGGASDTLTLKGNDFFGSSVSLSADGAKLAVGAYGDNGSRSGLDRGAVYLFTVYNTITQVKKITDGKGITLVDKDYFGASVSLSNDGSKLAVGASGAGDGAVYLYTVDWQAGGMTQTAKLVHGYHGISLGAADRFGASVSLSADGSKLAVGADYNNDGGSDKGAVHLINIPSTGDITDWQKQLNDGTDLKIVASNDITVNGNVNTLADMGTTGKLTLIAGRSITLNGNIKVKGGLVLTANNTTDIDDGNNDDGKLDANDRDTGKAVITVATGKTLSGGDNDVRIKMRTGKSGGAADKTQTGAITVWQVHGKRVSIIHLGATTQTSESKIVILTGGQIKAKAPLNKGGVVIALKADTLINTAGKTAVHIAGNTDGKGRYLVWTKTPADNQIGAIDDYGFAQFNKVYNTNGDDFQSSADISAVDDLKYISGFVYSANPLVSLTAAVTTKTKIYDSTSNAPSDAQPGFTFTHQTVDGLKFKVGGLVESDSNKTSNFNATVTGSTGIFYNTTATKKQEHVGDNLTLKYTAQVSYKDGNDKPVYGIPAAAVADISGASISPRALYLHTADLRVGTNGKQVYDGSPIADVKVHTGTGFKGMITGDTLSLNITDGAFAFADANQESNKPIAFADIGKISLNGEDKDNYRLVKSDGTAMANKDDLGITGDITARVLKLDGGTLTATPRVYDGTTAVTVVGGGFVGADDTTGVVKDDVGKVSLRIKAGAFVYADTKASKNINDNKQIKIGNADTLTLNGNDKGNYVLKIVDTKDTVVDKKSGVAVKGLTGIVNKRKLNLNVPDLSVTAHTYDGTADADAKVAVKSGYGYTTIPNDAHSLVSGDTVKLNIYSGALQFAGTKDVGSHPIKVKDINRITLTGISAGNYEMNMTNGDIVHNLKGTIEKRPLIVTATVQPTRPYDDDIAVKAWNPVLQAKSDHTGWVDGAAPTVKQATSGDIQGKTDDVAVGDNKRVILFGLSLVTSGVLGNTLKNYVLRYDTGKTTHITHRILSLDPSHFEVYPSPNTSIIASLYLIEGKWGYKKNGLAKSTHGDNLKVEIKQNAARYADKTVGTNKQVFVNDKTKFFLGGDVYGSNYKLNIENNAPLQGIFGALYASASGDTDVGSIPSGGGSGRGDVGIVLLGAGVALVMSGGTTAIGASTASTVSTGLHTPVGGMDTIFTPRTGVRLSGDMRAIYRQHSPLPSIFNTPKLPKVTYKAKYTTTYDLSLLAHNMKVQKSVPVYAFDAKVYETLKRIFVQQSAQGVL